ncbi:MAG: TIGR04168 family protein [Oscillatoriales cyanobacterium SM2_1_8]|nr:TIGR04168 family protein [Oscillatoriales cyanobacterium SM2_1_8]
MVCLNPWRETVRLAIVGDIHQQWAIADEEALQHLRVDGVLFVGDIGDEAIALVEQIAALPLPKAVILGNHDAHHSRKAGAPTDGVDRQLMALGPCHVGYGALDFPEWGLTVVGGRPFSAGGSRWRGRDFYQQRYGIDGFAASAERMVQCAAQNPETVPIFLSHNGPTGLGHAANAPCGCDWRPEAGDHGDLDLAEAIARTRALPKPVPLVVFGHMHHHLKGGQGQRTRCLWQDQTLYWNAACVPRHRPAADTLWHQFSVITLHHRQAMAAEMVWVDRHGRMEEREILWSVAPSS